MLERLILSAQKSFKIELSFIFVPTFEESGIFMLSVVFSFSQFSAIEILVYNKKIILH